MQKLQPHSNTFLHTLKISTLVLIVLISVLLIAFIIFGLKQTYKAEHSPNQQLFQSGKVPMPAPEGFYKGNVSEKLGKNWRGKVFDSSSQSGINQFSDGQRYNFKTYEAQGLRNRDLKVLRIDYHQKGNPWWLGFIVDEVVETEPGHYLGKVHLKIMPGLVLSLTYFELSKQ